MGSLRACVSSNTLANNKTSMLILFFWGLFKANTGKKIIRTGKALEVWFFVVLLVIKERYLKSIITDKKGVIVLYC